jgi:WS/DGAT/MGAT family acyltransferase
MTEHLTALDATFLELEQVDESAHMHIGAILVFDPRPDGTVPSCEELREHLAGRLGALPRYQQRLSTPHTGGLAWPAWEDDRGFDIDKHVTRAALPAPGGDQELRAWASGFFSQRLDRRRPLWEMALVEDLAGGRWALATKTHHCMVDGVGSVDVGHLILDTTPDPPTAARSSSPRGDSLGDARSSVYAERTPHAPLRFPSGPLGRVSRAWSRLLPTDALVHTAHAGVHSVLHPRESLHKARAALAMIVREELMPAPRTSLNEAIGTRRRFEVLSSSLADLKEIKSVLGGTVNDVALAITASGLRALLLSRGEVPPEQGLRAMVPMNVRQASEHLALGNKISSLFLDLPVAEPDALIRYRETSARSGALKSDGRQAEGTAAVIELTSLAPPVIHAALAQALYATRLFNITITNVPGPQQTLYAFGASLREIHPLVPLAAEHSVGVALISYDGSVFFGVVADPDVVPDLDVLLRGIGDSLEELRAISRVQRALSADVTHSADATSSRRPRRPAASSA